MSPWRANDIKHLDIRTATIGQRIRRHDALHRLADMKMARGLGDDGELRELARQAIAGIPDLGGCVIIPDENPIRTMRGAY
jgi:hypothetical protein